MEKKQYELCLEVLRRMANEHILDRMVLIGSWCLVFYEDYFTGTDYGASIRTRDMDFLIPLPARFKTRVDLQELLKDLGFILVHRGRDGYITFQNPDLIVEFLVPERGRGSDGPYRIPDLGINAQPLRFLDFLTENTIQISRDDVKVTIPHPIHFAIHKLVISPRRKNKEKGSRDTQQACALLTQLIQKGEADTIARVFSSIPKKWQATVRKELFALGEREILQIL